MPILICKYIIIIIITCGRVNVLFVATITIDADFDRQIHNNNNNNMRAGKRVVCR